MILDQVNEQIQHLISEALAAKGLGEQKVTADTVLLGGDLNLDSLDLAGIVVNLSDLTKKDPFAGGFIEFRTVGELARLYAA
jgi:acyl carrier protein